MKLENLKDLLVDVLEDLYDAEHQQSFNQHLKQTEGHVKRLEQIFSGIGQEPKSRTCKAMKGLLAEGKEMIKQDAAPEVKDAGLISAAQRVEHYEMAGYGSART